MQAPEVVGGGGAAAATVRLKVFVAILLAESVTWTEKA
jgi:hypothetical protein